MASTIIRVLAKKILITKPFQVHGYKEGETSLSFDHFPRETYSRVIAQVLTINPFCRASMSMMMEFGIL